MDATTPAASRGTTPGRETTPEPGSGSGPVAPGPDGSPGAGPRPPGTVPAESLDLRYQALSDPKRRRILELLGDDERCVCELVDEMEVGQSLLSFHLKTLRDAELVDCRRDGRWIHYRVRQDALAELRAHLLELATGHGNAFEEG